MKRDILSAWDCQEYCRELRLPAVCQRKGANMRCTIGAGSQNRKMYSSLQVMIYIFTSWMFIGCLYSYTIYILNSTNSSLEELAPKEIVICVVDWLILTSWQLKQKTDWAPIRVTYLPVLCKSKTILTCHLLTCSQINLFSRYFNFFLILNGGRMLYGCLKGNRQNREESFSNRQFDFKNWFSI